MTTEPRITNRTPEEQVEVQRLTEEYDQLGKQIASLQTERANIAKRLYEDLGYDIHLALRER